MTSYAASAVTWRLQWPRLFLVSVAMKGMSPTSASSPESGKQIAFHGCACMHVLMHVFMCWLGAGGWVQGPHGLLIGLREAAMVV